MWSLQKTEAFKKQLLEMKRELDRKDLIIAELNGRLQRLERRFDLHEDDQSQSEDWIDRILASRS